MPLRSASLLFFIDFSLSTDFATEDLAATDLAAGFIGLSSTLGSGLAIAGAARYLVVDFGVGAGAFIGGLGAAAADLLVPFFRENFMEEWATALAGFAAGFAPLLLAEGRLVGALATEYPSILS